MDYLLENWGLKVRENFILELERCLEIIKRNPYSFVCCDTPELRKCVITPLNMLYYIIKENDILIVSIEDTRMNPEALSNLYKSDNSSDKCR